MNKQSARPSTGAVGGVVRYICNTPPPRWEEQLEYLETWWGPRDLWSPERTLFALGLIWGEFRRERPTTKLKAKRATAGLPISLTGFVDRK
jgi:hypothetical protein